MTIVGGGTAGWLTALLRIRSGLTAKTVADPTLERSLVDQAIDDPTTATKAINGVAVCGAFFAEWPGKS